jgi:hypothetical protein
MITGRTPAKIWVGVLKVITPILAECHVTDVILFGSQAMSVYMERSLASKDLDLIAPNMSPNTLKKLCDELTQMAEKRPEYDFRVGDYMGREYPVAHIYLKHQSGFPLVLEFFQNFLGFTATRLAPFLTFEKRWGMEIQAPSPEAIIGTRLAFRPPDRITSFNASRLNRFIKHLPRINWAEVNTFIDTFDLRPIVTSNLDVLRTRKISIIGSSKIAKTP